MIYCIGNIDQKVCKIGFTNTLTTRLPALQTGCPFELSLIGVINGTMSEEKKLHNKFREFHLRDEWFTLSGPIINLFYNEDSAVLAPAPLLVFNMSRMNEIYALTGAELKTLLYIAKYCPVSSQQIKFNRKEQKKLSEISGISTASISNCLSKLVSAGVVTRPETGVYKLNPELIEKMPVKTDKKEMRAKIEEIDKSFA